MNEITLGILGVVGTIISLIVIYNMKNDFLQEFEKTCHESIKERDKKIEEKEKLNRELKAWLFK